MLDCVGNDVRQVACGSAWAADKSSDVADCGASFLKYLQSVLEVLVGFTWKADDKVGAEGEVGESLVEFFRKDHVVSYGVLAVHGLKDPF